jgi:hypothetical protein
MRPEISVVMSVFNGEKYLAPSIESVLGQSFGGFEFLIVDDGSTDDSNRLMHRYADSDPRIVVLENPSNMGLTKSLNIAFSKAKGRFIARQDADDISRADRLETQLAMFAGDPGVGFVGTSVTAIDEHGVPGATICAPTHNTLIRWQMLFRNVFKHGTVMIRRDVLENNHLRYDENMVYAQDYDLWSRMLLHSDGRNIARPLVLYRNHGQRISKAHAGEQSGFATRTSHTNLKRLGVSLTAADVGRLCTWLQQPPGQMTENEMNLCREYFHILSRFENSRRDLDPEITRRIRTNLTRHLFAAVSLKQLPDLATSGLLPALFRNGGATVCREFIRRTTRVVATGRHRRMPDIQPQISGDV